MGRRPTACGSRRSCGVAVGRWRRTGRGTRDAREGFHHRFERQQPQPPHRCRCSTVNHGAAGRGAGAAQGTGGIIPPAAVAAAQEWRVCYRHRIALGTKRVGAPPGDVDECCFPRMLVRWEELNWFMKAPEVRRRARRTSSAQLSRLHRLVNAAKLFRSVRQNRCCGEERVPLSRIN
jgi:hypothetical protein